MPDSYCYSTDGESFNGEYATRDDALAHACTDADAGERVWTGIGHPIAALQEAARAFAANNTEAWASVLRQRAAELGIETLRDSIQQGVPVRAFKAGLEYAVSLLSMYAEGAKALVKMLT